MNSRTKTVDELLNELGRQLAINRNADLAFKKLIKKGCNEARLKLVFFSGCYVASGREPSNDVVTRKLPDLVRNLEQAIEMVSNLADKMEVVSRMTPTTPYMDKRSWRNLVLSSKEHVVACRTLLSLTRETYAFIEKTLTLQIRKSIDIPNRYWEITSAISCYVKKETGCFYDLEVGELLLAAHLALNTGSAISAEGFEKSIRRARRSHPEWFDPDHAVIRFWDSVRPAQSHE